MLNETIDNALSACLGALARVRKGQLIILADWKFPSEDLEVPCVRLDALEAEPLMAALRTAIEFSGDEAHRPFLMDPGVPDDCGRDSEEVDGNWRRLLGEHLPGFSEFGEALVAKEFYAETSTNAALVIATGIKWAYGNLGIWKGNDGLLGVNDLLWKHPQLIDAIARGGHGSEILFCPDGEPSSKLLTVNDDWKALLAALFTVRQVDVAYATSNDQESLWFPPGQKEALVSQILPELVKGDKRVSEDDLAEITGERFQQRASRCRIHIKHASIPAPFIFRLGPESFA